MTILEEILASTREDVAKRARELPLASLGAGPARRPHAFRDALSAFAVIADASTLALGRADPARVERRRDRRRV